MAAISAENDEKSGFLAQLAYGSAVPTTAKTASAVPNLIRIPKNMPQGTIKKIISEKGFGFISTDGGGDDLFFHRNGCTDSFEDLREGDQVEYTAGQGPKGPCAEDVKPV